MPASDSISFQIILVIGMLVTGSINTVSKKMGYATCGVSLLPDSKVTACAAGYCGEGADGQTCPKSEWRSACPAGQHRFMKPWTQTLVMFAGEFMCIFVFFYKRRQYLIHQIKNVEDLHQCFHHQLYFPQRTEKVDPLVKIVHMAPLHVPPRLYAFYQLFVT